MGNGHNHYFNSQEKQGDKIREKKAIKTYWREERLVDDGQFDSIQITLYELDTEAGESPPMYFNRSKYPI